MQPFNCLKSQFIYLRKNKTEWGPGMTRRLDRRPLHCLDVLPRFQDPNPSPSRRVPRYISRGERDRHPPDAPLTHGLTAGTLSETLRLNLNFKEPLRRQDDHGEGRIGPCVGPKIRPIPGLD